MRCLQSLPCTSKAEVALGVEIPHWSARVCGEAAHRGPQSGIDVWITEVVTYVMQAVLLLLLLLREVCCASICLFALPSKMFASLAQCLNCCLQCSSVPAHPEEDCSRLKCWDGREPDPDVIT